MISLIVNPSFVSQVIIGLPGPNLLIGVNPRFHPILAIDTPLTPIKRFLFSCLHHEQIDR
ncbi:hypothetical protein O9X98_33125 [Agrobacterium salinitolerans]|nr:hypothetical protein [Agrobacterium salinitolerans]